MKSVLLFVYSCCSTPEVELTLLAFALARGSVAKVLSSLCTIVDHLDTPYDASSLISSMASVRQNLLLKYGKWFRHEGQVIIPLSTWDFLASSFWVVYGLGCYTILPG